MIYKLDTNQGISFLYDDTTVSSNIPGIINASFVLLKCYKIVTNKGYSYEYPEIIIRNQNMCKQSDIRSQKPANETEVEIYNRIGRQERLGKAIQKVLRNNYLITIDRNTIENDDSADFT